MIDHLTVRVSDLARSRAFYEAALRPLGYSVTVVYGPFLGFGAGGETDFWITQAPGPYGPTHLAFRARDRTTVRAFHAAALAAGARDNGPPGPRPEYHEKYYGAFVLDPDGYNLEAVCRKEEP